MTTVEEIAAIAAQALRPQPNVRFAILFGSAATRGPGQARDIDVAVSFSTSPSLMDRGVLAGLLEQVLKRDVDLVDLDSASTILEWQVLANGIPLVVNDSKAWRDFQVRVPIDYADLQPYHQRESDGLRRMLEKAQWSSSIS